MKTILVIICLFIYSNSFAGYGKTSWGMSLNKIKKLYPGGEVMKQNGQTEYYIVDEVSEHKDTLVNFSFNKNGKLDSVSLIFSKLGQPINLKTGEYTQMTKDQCEMVKDRLKTNLTLKYGKPQDYSNLKNITATSWTTKTDMVTIDCSSVGDPNLAAPIIIYNDIPKLEKQFDGL